MVTTSDDQTIDAVLTRMQQRIDALPTDLNHRRVFASTYLRRTEAVGAAIDDARFEDPAWVERWDVVFADLFLDAHDADRDGRTSDVPRPWRPAFDAPADLPPLRHVLLGINAHVNYDLPQAMLAVISDEDFTDPVLIDRRKRDHERIDAVLTSRVADENGMLGPLSVLDRLLRPLNQAGSKRFLREARRKVWLNVEQLQAAWPAPTRTGSDWPSWRCSAPRRSPICWRRGRCCRGLLFAGFGVVLPPL